MSGAVEYFMKHPELVEALPKEGLEMLLALVRAELRKGDGCMPPEARNDLVNCVPDALVRDIVHDLRKGVGEPGGFLPASGGGMAVPKKGSGWIKNPPPLEPPPGVRHVDRIADHFAQLDKMDQMEKAERMKRRI